MGDIGNLSQTRVSVHTEDHAVLCPVPHDPFLKKVSIPKTFVAEARNQITQKGAPQGSFTYFLFPLFLNDHNNNSGNGYNCCADSDYKCYGKPVLIIGITAGGS